MSPAYQISALEVGQSLLIENANPETIKVIACRKGKALGWKFKTSKQRSGVMVWRIA